MKREIFELIMLSRALGALRACTSASPLLRVVSLEGNHLSVRSPCFSLILFKLFSSVHINKSYLLRAGAEN
jgi:hypothetical protein